MAVECNAALAELTDAIQTGSPMSQKSRMAILLQLAALCCALAVHDSAVLAQSRAVSSDAAVSLFDGKSLDGWEGDPEHWQVNNGVSEQWDRGNGRMYRMQYDATYEAAMEVLCGRVASANLVLDRIAEGALPKSQLTAYSARQMSSLADENLNKRLSAEWGMFGQSSAELKAEIATLATAYKTAPLWAYNDGGGAVHFKKLCATCHLPNQQSEALAPKLAGSGSKGIDYLVENVIDPNADIGRDFQARIIVTTEGRVITGLIEKESDSSITVRTLTESVTVAKGEIGETKTSPNSFMPEGLWKTLNDRERIELFKYLMAQ